MNYQLNTLAVGILAVSSLLSSCQSQEKQEAANQDPDSVQTQVASLTLPPPYATESVRNEGKAIGWEDGQMPQAPAGFKVEKFAADLEHPRWIYQAPNGDVFVAESNTKKSANRITLFRGGNPAAKTAFLEDLDQPFGMLVLGNYFYVANTGGLMRFPYQASQTKMTAKGEKILDLPAGGYNNHWTRNLLASPDGSKIYISVGSASNVAEHGMDEEKRRANILVINPDGSGEEIYASGLRNPVGMDWVPGTSTLWTAVNERDELGDDLVPDYLTSVKKGGFYGWPYSYYGQNVDPRRKDEAPELVKQAIVPDVPLGSHTASLGLAFYDKDKFPSKYQGGAFIGQHGSWNRSQLSGYKVVFVPFKDGKPSGKMEDFLTGFIANSEDSKVYGRPVGVTVLDDGSMLVADDDSGTIWRISAQ
ncbi:PQQ-dependent sugar dehydrogenase [Persicitalea jodogahamensis]|uniref:Sorbosone dehydrogenase n=1 Tax=Persicitalea jodogahamensis TaxID=402147 RepID=A0A8J3D5B0_9BACT|nr:sorbosone dehydrogenase family protein [Persicitalea jodogahamensis]GHB77266.1 sorbosone dehydrogenase [Persicitalea jodogahamensis]